MRAPFQTEEQVGTRQHASAEEYKLFDDLARYGSGPVIEGFATPHAESIDPYMSTIAYSGLSMPFAAGIASAKVGKRKSRANRKPPIKVFSADSSNFMAMVHRLTGFESSAYLLAGSPPQASVLKPFGTTPAAQYNSSFMQGMYVPDPPAPSDKMTKSFSDDTFSSALLQRIPSFSRRKQLDSIDDASVSSNKGLFGTFSSPSGTARLPPYMHSQVSNSWDSGAAAVLLPNEQDDAKKKDRRREENCSNSFNEQRTLHEDVGAVRH